jgi:predicted RNase H-like nuclease (RuvC/YqgF family)
MQSLRSTFRKEFNKVEKSIISGSGSDEIKIPVLYGTYYDLLMFIKDQEQPSPSISNIRSPSVLSEDINNDNNDLTRIAMQEKMIENLNSESQELENMDESLELVAENLLTNISSYFSRSPKRQSILEEFQTFMKSEKLKVLKISKTSWLCQVGV